MTGVCPEGPMRGPVVYAVGMIEYLIGAFVVLSHLAAIGLHSSHAIFAVHDLIE
jgi:hypothetical protein